jgi:uncharacterized protein YecA (UPF0149 family)
MNIEEAITQFATAGSDLPKEAMRWCVEHWDEAAPRLLEMLDRYIDGSDRSDETTEVVFFALHLMAEKSEARAFASLCRLASDREAIVDVLSDGISLTLSQMLISTFDGNLDTLKALVENPDADEFARSAALQAIAWLTAAGRADRSEVEAWVTSLLDKLRKEREAEWILVSWIDTVAMLGMEHLTPVVKKLFEIELINSMLTDFSYFESDLKETLDDPERMAGFARERIHPLTDAVGELSTWYAFSEKRKKDEKRRSEMKDLPWHSYRDLSTPVTNPLKTVGRNDPCPCGSGKKYKKCCLK